MGDQAHYGVEFTCDGLTTSSTIVAEERKPRCFLSKLRQSKELGEYEPESDKP